MGARVLVIDDEETVRDAFELALESTHYQVESLDCGEAGLEAARRSRPDFVYLDLKMPGMDGIQTLRRLNESFPGLPVYIVTAFVPEYLDQLAAAAREGLTFGLAQKPLSGEQIRLIVKGMLEGAQAG